MKPITNLFVNKIDAIYRRLLWLGKDKKLNQKPGGPTNAELEILRILWSNGPCTVKQVHELLPDNPPRGYTTILKILQIMSHKGLVKRYKESRAHIYQASFDAELTQKSIISNLLDKLYNGSSGKMVMQALSANPVSPDELKEIRKLLDKLEGESK